MYFFHSFAGNTNFNYTWGGFTGGTSTGSGYITINSSSTSGGAGFSLSPALNISGTPAASTYLVLSARLGDNHNGSDLRLVLVTNSGTVYTEWSIPATAFNNITFTTVSIPLTTPPFLNAGGGYNPLSIIEYNFQADHFSPGNFNVELEFLGLTPEPEQVVMVALVVLLVGAVVLKRYKQKRAAVLASTKTAGM
jgi:hypothetical protein